MKKLLSFILVLIMLTSSVSFSSFANVLEESVTEEAFSTEKITTDKSDNIEEYDLNDVSDIIVEETVTVEESVPLENHGRESGTFVGNIVTASGICGSNVFWDIDEFGVLTVHGEGAMYDWDAYKEYAPWYSYHELVKNVIINSGVTTIGDCAFFDCTSLESVTIADSVTKIGFESFCRCTSLKSVSLGSGIESVEGYAFNKCTALNKVDIMSLEAWFKIKFARSGESLNYNYTSPLAYTGNLYLNGVLVEDIVVPETVTVIPDYSLYGCTSLKSITIHDGVTEIGLYAFQNCTALTRVDITSLKAWCNIKFATQGSNPLYYAKGLFLNNSKVENISADSNIENINDYAFCGYVGLKSIDIPYGVTAIGEYSFTYTSLTSITIPDSVTYIGNGAFGNTPIKRIVIPNSVNTIGFLAFRACGSLEHLTVPFIGKYRYEETDDYQYPLGYWFGSSSYAGGVKTSQSYYFTSYVSSKEYYIPSSLKFVTITDSTIQLGAFSNCGNIRAVTVAKGVTKVGERAFYGCSSLSEVSLPDTLTELSKYAFTDCINLKKIVLPDNLTEIGSYCFSGCTGLVTADLPLKATYVASYMFSGCTALENVAFKNNLKSIGASAFSSCTALKNISIPIGVTEIGSYAFRNCFALTQISLPDTVTNIALSAFDNSGYYNTSSNWVDDVLYINNHLIKAKTSISFNYSIKPGTKCVATAAFRDCTSLTNVSIPKSVISICSNAFYNTALYNNPENWEGDVLYIGDCLIEAKDTLSGEYIVKDGTRLIASFAIFSCSGLEVVSVPNTVKYIGICVFDYCDGVKVRCHENSVAEAYALANSIPISYLHTRCIFTNYISNNDGNCYEDGTMTAYCDLGCGKTDTVTEPDSKVHDYYLDVARSATCQRDGLAVNICDICRAYYTEVISKVDHKFSSYIYNNDATCYADGTKTAMCSYGCGASDTITAADTAGHSFTNYVYNEDATCQKNGTKTAYCDFGCGNSKTITASFTKLPHDYKKEIIEAPTCINKGMMICICKGCLNYTYEYIPVSSEHSGEWKVTVEPTVDSEGEKTRVCELCGVFETEAVAKIEIPILDTDNYTVSVTSADYIKYIRYAYGQYNSSAEIKNASDCVTLNQRSVGSYTDNGTVKLEMPKGGYYSFWIKLNDGSEYIYIADLSVMVQSVSVATNNVTVHNLYGVKDFFIAYGEQDNYRAVKDNLLVQVTNKKIGENHDYSYLINKSGRYTLCVRYEDATREYSYITFEVILPEVVFTGNGAKLNVSGIDDVKVIRYAYGEYNSVAQIKRAEGNVSYTGKGRLKDLSEYTLEFSKEGPVSVAVVFNNGYTVIYKYIF